MKYYVILFLVLALVFANEDASSSESIETSTSLSNESAEQDPSTN